MARWCGSCRHSYPESACLVGATEQIQATADFWQRHAAEMALKFLHEKDEQKREAEQQQPARCQPPQQAEQVLVNDQTQRSPVPDSLRTRPQPNTWLSKNTLIGPQPARQPPGQRPRLAQPPALQEPLEAPPLEPPGHTISHPRHWCGRCLLVRPDSVTPITIRCRVCHNAFAQEHRCDQCLEVACLYCLSQHNCRRLKGGSRGSNLAQKGKQP